MPLPPALRQLRRSPSFSAIVIAVFALGLGASTAIFSVVNGVLLRPLPYPDAGRIVQFWEVSAKGGTMPVANPNYEDLKARSRAFSAVAEMADYGVTSVTGGQEPLRAHVAVVSENFFHVLDVRADRGRLFLPSDQQIGAAPTAVISTGLWQRAFGGSASVLGATLNLNGRTYTVVGILPASVDEPSGTEIWLPSGLDATGSSRTAHNWDVLGRLRDDVPLAQAQRDISGIMKGLRDRYGDQIDATDGLLVPLREQLTDRKSVV